MARKHIRLSNRLLFTLLLLVGLLFLFAPQSLTNKFQFAFAHVFRWPLSIGRNISLAASTHRPFTQHFPKVLGSRTEMQYQNHIDTLEEWLRQERQKVQRLSGLRERLPLEGAKLVLAAVSMVPEGPKNELIINRGQDDGLAIGQFVLGDNSIIGTISDVSTRTARVRLITDSTSKIAVKIGKLNINRIMQGDGNNSAKIPLVSTAHKINVGDKVFALAPHQLSSSKVSSPPQDQDLSDTTIGAGLDYPMIIGEVARCKKDDENPSLWDITVKPVCDIERLNDVAVIIYPVRKKDPPS